MNTTIHIIKQLLTLVKKLMMNILNLNVISDLKDKEIVETIYKNELQKANKKDFRVQQLIKRKGYKLYVK